MTKQSLDLNVFAFMHSLFATTPARCRAILDTEDCRPGQSVVGKDARLRAGPYSFRNRENMQPGRTPAAAQHISASMHRIHCPRDFEVQMFAKLHGLMSKSLVTLVSSCFPRTEQLEGFKATLATFIIFHHPLSFPEGTDCLFIPLFVAAILGFVLCISEAKPMFASKKTASNGIHTHCITLY